MAICYIGVGGNLHNPLETVRKGCDALAAADALQVEAVSPFYRSKPMGPQDQPEYVNAVVKLSTELTPQALLQVTQSIELSHGRVRKAERWGPRTLDLDILLYDSLSMDTPTLTIPHYGLTEREFVIYPLLDICPELVLPCGTQVQTLTERVPLNGMIKVE